jgi:hypothetical protein
MFVALIVAMLAAGSSSYPQGFGPERTVTVMTRYVDEGTDLDFILAAGSIDELLAAVAQTYEEVVVSNIP